MEKEKGNESFYSGDLEEAEMYCSLNVLCSCILDFFSSKNTIDMWIFFEKHHSGIIRIFIGPFEMLVRN